jgi:hypothetical protein
MAFPPYTFASQTGNVPAAQLDANFSACVPLAVTGGPGLYGISSSAGNVSILGASAIYAIVKGSIPWEFVAFMGGTQGGSSWQVGRYVPSAAVIISQGQCNSSSGVAALGSTTFTIADNGSSIGTVVFSASGTTGTVTITGSPYTLAAGHVLTITGPASADTNLANVSFTLAGTRA